MRKICGDRLGAGELQRRAAPSAVLFRFCAEAIIYPLGKPPNLATAQSFLLTCDLSRSGLRVLHSEPLVPGQRLDVILNGQPPRTTEIVWCKRLENGRYAVGCRFTAEA